MNEAIATVEAPVFNDLEKRISVAINSGELDYSDSEVAFECANRYITYQHSLRTRHLARDVEQRAKVRAEENARINAKLREQIARLAKEHFMQNPSEWGPALLRSEFSTGDGGKVSMGDATLAQHERCLERLVAQSAGITETAAIHSQIIRELKAAGVDSLNQLVESLVALA